MSHTRPIRVIHVFIVASLFLFDGTYVLGLARAQQHRHWHETATVTIWKGRYSNCDYGYYVDLPDGTVAHGQKPPAPNHGVVIDLASRRGIAPLSARPGRYIDISSHYNAAGLSSLQAIVGNELGVLKEGKRDFRVVRQSRTRLGGRPAMMVWSEYKVGTTALLATEVIAYRPPGPTGLGDIIYKLSMVTTHRDYPRDLEVFRAIVAGFHFTRLPLGPCSKA